MYLSFLQRTMCRQIEDAQLHSIADCVKLNFYHVEKRLYSGEVVKVMPFAEAERFEVRSSMRSFITLWYLLEKYDLIRSFPGDPKENRQALYMQKAGGAEPNLELWHECNNYLDKQIFPLTELHYFIEDNKNEDDWLTREQRNTREAIRAAKKANTIAWIGVAISFMVGTASILIPVLKN